MPNIGDIYVFEDNKSQSQVWLCTSLITSVKPGQEVVVDDATGIRCNNKLGTYPDALNL